MSGQAILVTSVGGAAGLAARRRGARLRRRGPDRAGLLVELTRAGAPRPDARRLGRGPRAGGAPRRPPAARSASPRAARSATWRCRPTPTARARSRRRSPWGASSTGVVCTCRRGSLHAALEEGRPGIPRRCCGPTSAGPRPVALAVRDLMRRGSASRFSSSPSPGSRRGGPSSAVLSPGAAGSLAAAPARAPPVGPHCAPRPRVRERGQALLLALGGCFVLIAARAGAGRDRRGGHRQRAGAAGGRPGGDLGGALDARRPAAAALAAAPCPTALPNPSTWRSRPTSMRARDAALRRGPRERRRACAPADRLPRPVSFAPVRAKATVLAELDVGAGASHGRSLGRSRSGGPARAARRRRCRRSPAAAATAARSSTATARGCDRTWPPPTTGWPPPRPPPASP